nr:hypothetical protein [Tanacetum cinerariifolium]
MSEHDPDPPNPPPLYDKSNEFNKTYKKPEKKPDKSLRDKKTTRTMNPEPKVVTKHGKLLSSTQVNVKRVGTHFGAKEGVPGIIDDGMADGFDEEEGMEVVDDGTEDWLVSEEDLNIKKVKDEDGKKSEVSKGVFGNDYNFNVSVMFLELINDKMSRNSIDSSVIFDGMPEV